MKRPDLLLLCVWAFAAGSVVARAQTAPAPVEAQASQPEDAEASPLVAVCESPTPQVNVPTRLLITVPAGAALPTELPSDNAEVSFVQWQREDTVSAPSANAAGGTALVVLTFIPRVSGLLTLPVFEIDVPAGRAPVVAPQLLVGEPQRSDGMGLTMQASATHVRVGEPVRLDFTWDCALPVGRLQQLDWAPRFFANPDIEVDIPRSGVPAERQIGLPVGGRRIIAEWEKSAEYPAQLGRVRFSVFVRFKKSGAFELPAGRLNLVERLTAGGSGIEYAAYFNNNFFAPVEPSVAHRCWFVECAPLTVQVADLPPNMGETFSGWFAPCRIEAAVAPASGEVGQLMELRLRVFSATSAGFLAAPALAQQPALRHRFWVDNDVRRIWHPDGVEFLLHFRPLTTAVRAFPELRFTVFDAVSGTYQTVVTAAQPLVVLPSEGRTVFNRNELADNPAPPDDQPKGIWHNEPATRFSDLMTFLINLLADGFCYWLALFGLLAVVARPVMEKRRRLALDSTYRQRVMAYRAFRRCPEQSVAQMAAFREWMAALSGTQAAALTSRDIEKILSDLGLSSADVVAARALFEAQDVAVYGREKSPPQQPPLGALARRIARAAQGAALLLLVLVLLPPPVRAADHWTEAEAAFSAGHEAAAGSLESTAKFTEAALKFEAVANANLRPDRAWYNAGNAWMEAGQLGRAIAAYRQAWSYRPFDQHVQQSLQNARSLRLDNVPVLPVARWQWPLRWLQAAAVVVTGLLVGGWLAYVRFRNRATRLFLGLTAVGVLVVGTGMFRAERLKGHEGVVIVNEVQARKGPAYRYEPAFAAPLHDGTECVLIENRGDWQRVVLTDGRECWLPATQVSWQ